MWRKSEALVFLVKSSFYSFFVLVFCLNLSFKEIPLRHNCLSKLCLATAKAFYRKLNKGWILAQAIQLQNDQIRAAMESMSSHPLNNVNYGKTNFNFNKLNH